MEDEVSTLKNQIKYLNLILERNKSEIETLNNTVQDLEDELLKFHEIIAEGVSLDHIEQVIESRFKFDLKAKDREIRDLKNKLGFLRKEKLEKERELSEIKGKNVDSSVLRVEDIRYEQSLEKKDKRIKDLEQIIEAREKKIENLTSLIEKIKSEQESRPLIENADENKVLNDNSKEQYKKKIKKYKSKVKQLKKRLSEANIDDKAKTKAEIELLDLRNMLSRLQKNLEEKNQRIRELETLNRIK